MIASSPRLIFEAMETRHAPHFYALNNDPQVMQYFPSTLDHAATDAFIARVMAHRAAHGFGLETVFLADTDQARVAWRQLLRTEYFLPDFQTVLLQEFLSLMLEFPAW